MKVWIVETVREMDGGWLPDARQIYGVFSSAEKANDYVKNNPTSLGIFDTTEYEVDEE